MISNSDKIYLIVWLNGACLFYGNNKKQVNKNKCFIKKKKIPFNSNRNPEIDLDLLHDI